MIDFKDAWRRFRSLGYRHYICIAITLAFLGCGFVFHNALPRLAEAVCDLGVSLAFYACGLFTRGYNPITPTVTALPSWEFAPSRFERLHFLPYTWEEFKQLWSVYWQRFATWENVQEYLWFLSDLLYYASKLLLILMPLVLVVWLWARRYTGEQNNDYGVASKPLRRWQHFTVRVLFPVKEWCCSFGSFLRSNSNYLKFWLFLWLLYFNAISMVVDFLAYYLYLIVSFDLLSLYPQILKLSVDLAPVVRFIPAFAWAIIGVVALNAFCRGVAYAALRHAENKNRGFLNERGVVTIVYGPMGVGKTALLTSMSLTEEVNLRDQALEILLETDLMFPEFPWEVLRLEMRARMESREIVDVPSVRRWLGRWRPTFEWLAKNNCCSWWHRQVRKRGLEDVSFGYDFAHHPYEYNDGLKIVSLYSAIEDYACAYLVYTIESSLIVSNYAIRTDAILEDLGNFPIWNSDFFKRDPRLMESFSRHSHIIDFDMLRLGKRMIEDNPNRNAFGFGIYVVSEIDKERKNALELKETKINVDGCNQKNDLFNSCLKMSRHACVIANRVFLKIICDLQRPEDWGAGGREVGEIVYIADHGELQPALPFFSPFWICEGIFKRIKEWWENFYVTYIHQRADRTFFVQAVKGLISKLDNHYRKVNNTFGCQVLNLEVESGRMTGESEKRKFYRMPKKDFSRRYSTNCLSAIFEGDVPNTISIADLREYADIMATSDELAAQNSHFQNDIRKMKAQTPKGSDADD